MFEKHATENQQLEFPYGFSTPLCEYSVDEELIKVVKDLTGRNEKRYSVACTESITRSQQGEDKS